MRKAIALALLAACGGGGKTPQPDGPLEDGRTTVAEVPVTLNRNLDVLFVIDDSGSMADKQNNLAANFPNFVNRLSTVPGGLPDIHLGVVTTDMGTKTSGSAQPAPPIGQVGQGGCAMTGKSGNLTVSGAPVTGTFLSDIKLADGSRQKNYTGDLAQVFGQMARVGSTGCGFEQPLAAMKAALNDNPSNAGFLRPDAVLAVVFLADEDDCSAKSTTLFAPESPALGPLQSFRCTRFGVTCGQGGTTPNEMNQVGTKGSCTANTASDLLDTVEEYRDFLVGLKSDPKKVVVSSIMGVVEPFAVELRAPPGGGTAVPALAHSCTFNGANGPEVADPGVRFKSFTDLFPDRNAFSSICQSDLSGALDLIGNVVTSSIGSPCLTTAPADADPNTPGVQVDCIVEQVVGASATPLAECDALETPPCWKIETDPVTCPAEPSLKLAVELDTAPPPEAVFRMRCVVP
jgi:hypothetical protein